MKIVATDNFAREDIADVLVAENIKYGPYAQIMCNALNKEFSGDSEPFYFYVREDNYRLSRGMEDLF